MTIYQPTNGNVTRKIAGKITAQVMEEMAISMIAKIIEAVTLMKNQRMPPSRKAIPKMLYQ